MADAIVSENRLRSASKGAATGTGYTSGGYRPVKREEQPGQWYWFISLGETHDRFDFLRFSTRGSFALTDLNSPLTHTWTSLGDLFGNGSTCQKLISLCLLSLRLFDFWISKMARAATILARLLTFEVRLVDLIVVIERHADVITSNFGTKYATLTACHTRTWFIQHST